MKKSAWGLFLSCVLCSAVLHLHSINFAKASGTIYIRANGSIEGTDKIQRAGNVYTFTAAINDEIVVERNNIVLDGAGFALQGTGSGRGIYLGERSNVTVRNMEITDYPTCIYVLGSTSCTISRNSLTAIQENGICISGSMFTLISENNIMDRSSSTYGIGIGIYVVDSNHTTIVANSISRVNYAVRVIHVSNSILMENSLVNNLHGIYTAHAFSNNISRNNCTSNLPFQGETVLEHITRQGIGISLGPSSSSNYVYQNNIEGNMWGMEHESLSTHDNRIFENLVANNDYGVVLTRLFNNEFYHNTFLNNTLQVYDWANYDPTWGFSENTWDKGHLVGGNFWDTAVGDDVFSGPKQNETCNDGILDVPHFIDSQNQDNYPLANPWQEHVNPPVARFSYYPTVSSVGEKTVFNASSSYDLDDDIVSYYWDFGDENTSSTPNSTIIHIFKLPQVFNVTLTVTDSKDLNSSYSRTVWVRMITSVSISTSSTSNFIGFATNINGTLCDLFGSGLRNETIVLFYTFSGTSTWTPITSDTTDNLGNYQAVWIPPATGDFIIKAEWTGNSTHVGSYNTTNLTTFSYEDEYIFCVESNSTVSSIEFESTNLTLRFMVTSSSETQGYVKVTVAKTLVRSIEDVEVKVNDEEVDYTITLLDDSYLLYLTYLHSTHKVTITLGHPTTSFIETLPGEFIAFAALSIVAVVAVILFTLKRSQRLKEDKPRL